MVLIFSNIFDQSTNNVMDWLNYMKIPTIRINGGDDRYIFDHIDSSGIYFYDLCKSTIVNIELAKSCWWRRQGLFTNRLSTTQPCVTKKADVDLTPFMLPHNKWLNLEAVRLREYIYTRLYKSIPVNLGKPLFDFNRLEVLMMAQKCGLKIPRFAIVRNSNEIKRYCKTWGTCVSKAISNGLYDEHGGRRYYTYTELIPSDDLEDGINLFPSLICENIIKSFEIRSFYLNGSFYSMAIFSQTDELTKIDYRKYANNRNEPFLLPEDVKRKTKRLFKNIDINTGSIDYMVDQKGDYYFLEINPVGQYGMTDFPCNYELDCKIANYLAYGVN